MRRMSLLIAVVALGSCSTTPQEASYDARGEARLQQALAGKVAGKAMDCLPTYRSADMIRVDDDTLLFRDGANRVYRNELNGSCSGIGSSNYALVTNSFGGSGRICRGDIAKVVDLAAGFTVGSCVIGEFVPYSKPAA
ncbi:MAG: DUF6491 family protein [Sphingomicrobium sp.]